jgi:ornithine cyclodeaminase/alanine dehydrogenase-like protein (mu-crystallin family)
VLILSRGDLERLLTPLDVMAALEAAIELHAAGHGASPPRSTFPVPPDAVLLLMPALLSGEARDLGAKLVTVHPGNRARGYPTLHATYVLMDAATGQPLALLEGTFLTALRTGAASGLVARRLARPDAARLLCFGAGVQAAFQLACLAAVRPPARVVVVGRDAARARQFAHGMRQQLGVEVDLATDPRQAVREADIITCATTSATPVVFGADVQPGAHVDLVGAFRPTDREADTALVQRARVVVDTYEGALASAGDLLIPMRDGVFSREHIVADLTELVTRRRPVRRSPEDVTLFKSVGWALEDLATARLAYNRARELEIGTEVTL